MTKNKLLILGANNPETVRILQDIENTNSLFDVIGFLDDDPAKKGGDFYGYSILGPSSLVKEKIYLDCLISNVITSNCKIRKKTCDILEDYGANFTNLVHPSVNLAMVKIGTGCVIHQNVVIQPETAIGNYVAINSHVTIPHYCNIGNYCFFAPGATLAGAVEMGECTFVGVNATILPGIKIGSNVIIGAGAVVVNNVLDNTTVVGNPAIVINK